MTGNTFFILAESSISQIIEPYGKKKEKNKELKKKQQ